MCVCVCGAQSEAITGRPDDKIVQSEHGRRMKVGGDGTEEGEIRCEEKRPDGEYSTKHLVVNVFFLCFAFCIPQELSHKCKSFYRIKHGKHESELLTF